MNEQHQETFHVLLLGENKILMSYVLYVGGIAMAVCLRGKQRESYQCVCVCVKMKQRERERER